MRLLTIGLAGLMALAASAAVAQAPAEPYGVWINHHQTVKVETRSCGDLLCGSVVWATPEAREVAKEYGTDPLIGTQLLSGYRHTRDGTWQGQVFVPDLRRHFFSRIEQVGPDKLKISGCIMGGLLCKSQTWTRA